MFLIYTARDLSLAFVRYVGRYQDGTSTFAVHAGVVNGTTVYAFFAVGDLQTETTHTLERYSISDVDCYALSGDGSCFGCGVSFGTLRLSRSGNHPSYR